MRGTNRDPIRRGVRLARMFEAGQKLTVRCVMDKFHIHRPSAQHLINAVSMEIPVAEVGEIQRRGFKAIVYGLME